MPKAQIFNVTNTSFKLNAFRENKILAKISECTVYKELKWKSFEDTFDSEKYCIQ